MTKLIINDNRVDHMPIPVEAGQLRTDGEILVLITKVESRNGELIMKRYPHVIENARITVDLNEA